MHKRLNEKGRAGSLVLSHSLNLTKEKQKLPPINTREASAGSESSRLS